MRAGADFVVNHAGSAVRDAPPQLWIIKKNPPEYLRCGELSETKSEQDDTRHVFDRVVFNRDKIAMKSLPGILAIPFFVFSTLAALAQAPQINPANPSRGVPVAPGAPVAQAGPTQAVPSQAAPAQATPTQATPAQEPRTRRARKPRGESGSAATGTKRTPSPAQVALRDRQKQCGVQWRADKAAGKIQTGQKWPQYWSACNKRLKSASST